MTALLLALAVAIVNACILLRDRVAKKAAEQKGTTASGRGDVIFVLLFLGFLIYAVWARGFLAGVGLTFLTCLGTVLVAALLDGWLTPWLRKRMGVAEAKPQPEPAPAPPEPPAREATAEERIWRIRDSIQELENAKDATIALLEAPSGMDTAWRDMWIGDAKEAYYSVVAAWEMLKGASEKRERAGNARSLLDAARSRTAQWASELRSLGTDQARRLEAQLNAAFEKCYEQFSVELAPYEEKPEVKPPEHRIIRVSADHYELPCSVCGKISVVFRVGKPADWEKPETYLLYSGITGGIYPGLNIQLAEKALGLLEKGDLAALHSYMEEAQALEDGIDAYCPQCDAIFCWQHYNAYETYDEGFYDCTYGTCPQGHRRIIDD